MIVRAVLDESFNLDDFDFFNDYADTKAWLKRGARWLNRSNPRDQIIVEKCVRKGKLLEEAYLRWSDPRDDLERRISTLGE